MDPSLYFALPESFDPLTSPLDFEQWVRKFKACATANKWEDDDQLKHLPPLLRGDAWIVYDELKPNEKDTMVSLVKNLSHKLNIATQMQSSEQLYRRTLDSGSESLLTYQNDIKRLAYRAYPDMTADQVAPIILTAFIRGLRGHSMSLARKVRNANPKTLQLALEKAQFLLSDPFEDGDVSHESELMAVKRGTYEAELDGVYATDGAISNSLSEKPASSLTSPAQGETTGMPSWVPTLISALRRDDRKCNYCGKVGHLEAHCFKKQRDKGYGPVQKRPRQDVQYEKCDEAVDGSYPRTMGVTCGYCLRKNHTEEQCQTKKKALALKSRLAQGN
ncbi:hypothetical protein Pmar_PMAR021377 [Perkinsus marinus ATCC 50983]|uniref:CCHC-type domain-containing protein n=1 Tax=Perkinsus marinus (strain ATCC 50983 / TXsc) TaxID=423536 RepID=C5KX46_PERM5|nr:hypothetical protein Pmar_PMAR021377 [Perkinsus marinus ATCC 50983]EER10902.1 hypothetical protein Pmar_PMAR021377 [Perkinsus marinus ATCC 50983]|eukprot:XP_002779107.1 hypothetical protein Pmar_PMAR021377 [Perkinsus marinus ATCC 50983]